MQIENLDQSFMNIPIYASVRSWLHPPVGTIGSVHTGEEIFSRDDMFSKVK